MEKIDRKETLEKHGRDFAVMPLEGLWWSTDMEAFREGRKHDWLTMPKRRSLLRCTSRPGRDPEPLSDSP